MKKKGKGRLVWLGSVCPNLLQLQRLIGKAKASKTVAWGVIAYMDTLFAKRSTIKT